METKQQANYSNKSNKITNCTSLRNDLLEQYELLKVGAIDVKTIKEFANLSGKILSSASLQLKYKMLTNSENCIIEFMED